MPIWPDGTVHSRVLSQLLSGSCLPNNSFCALLSYIDHAPTTVENSNSTAHPKLLLTLPFSQLNFANMYSLHYTSEKIKGKKKSSLTTYYTIRETMKLQYYAILEKQVMHLCTTWKLMCSFVIVTDTFLLLCPMQKLKVFFCSGY